MTNLENIHSGNLLGNAKWARGNVGQGRAFARFAFALRKMDMKLMSILKLTWIRNQFIEKLNID